MYDPDLTFFMGDHVIIGCKYCGHVDHIPCTPEQWSDYVNRAKCIQDIFPELDPGRRELFVTNICDVCWELTTNRISADGLNAMYKSILDVLNAHPDFKDVSDAELRSLSPVDLMSYLNSNDEWVPICKKIRSIIKDAYNMPMISEDFEMEDEDYEEEDDCIDPGDRDY